MKEPIQRIDEVVGRERRDLLWITLATGIIIGVLISGFILTVVTLVAK